MVHIEEALTGERQVISSWLQFFSLHYQFDKSRFRNRRVIP